MTLDRRTILDAALQLVDEGGLDGLTMRRLGERLGVSHMAAYRHFADRDAIIHALVDEILVRMRLPVEEAELIDAEERIVGFLLRTRHVLLAHPALVTVVADRPFDQMQGQHDVVEVYKAAGFSEDLAVAAALTTASLAISLILFETRTKQRASSVDRDLQGRIDRFRGGVMSTLLAETASDHVTADDLTRVAEGSWEEAVYEVAIRECFTALLRHAGSDRPTPTIGQSADDR